jgi:nicotinamide-nucleotide amidase
MRVETVAIGNEVLEGLSVDTNGAFLGRELTERGYQVCRHTVLPDESEALFQGLKEALSRSTFVIATGGLGPTMDDLTKNVSLRLFRTSLQMDSNLYDEMKGRLGNVASLPDQARVPQNAIMLRNRIGTASGFLFLSTEGSLMLLPGVPREMEQMFLEEALPLLAEHFPIAQKQQSAHIYLCQLSELMLDPILREIESAHPDAKIGIYPSLGSLQIRFSVARDFDRLDQWTKRIRNAFGTYLFEGPSLQEVVQKALRSQGRTLALAESCTGGALSARLVSISNTSQYLLGSIVAYSNEWKEQFLGVKHQTLEQHGAVSVETAREMVAGLFKHSKADFAIAITGIAGPMGGSLEKPVGTIYIAIGERGGAIDAGKIQAPPQRSSVIEFALQYALGALWRRLAYQELTFL